MAAALTVLFIALLSPRGAVAGTVLRMNHQFPATAEGARIDAWFAEEVERATGGEVRIKIFWAGALGGPKENLALLSAGAIHLAAMSAGYYPSELPLHAAPNSLPMAMDNPAQASAIMKTLTDEIPAYELEAARHGVKSLFFHILNPYYLFSREPVQGFDDLAGMKIRTWGEFMPVLVKSADAVPVTVFLPELYENLQRGVIDACPFSLDLAVAYNIHEVAPHVSEVVLWEGPSWGVWVNREAWNDLSPENRAAILKAAERARHKELKAAAKAEERARRTLQEAGVAFHDFPPGDLARWKEVSPDFLELWTERMSLRGLGEESRRAARLWRNMREELR
jgi:TRAP-type C4-dicarboxylate transport system substrate-binding protein